MLYSLKLNYITCTLEALAEERDSVGDEYVPPFSKSGVLKRTSADDTTNYYAFRDSITKVHFEDKLIAHETAEDLIFDVSEAQDASVMSYLVPNVDDNSKYTLFIQSDSGVKANSKSNYLFYSFSNLKEIVGMEYFDTSDVMDMSHLLDGCLQLERIDLTNLVTTKVTKTNYMFSNCSKLDNLDVSHFNMSNVVDLSNMFKGCKNITNLDVSTWDTSNVTNMQAMFQSFASLKELDLSNWDTSNVLKMKLMFIDCVNLETLNISNFKVTDMTTMFKECHNLENIDLAHFDFSSATTVEEMLNDTRKLNTIININFASTTNYTNMLLDTVISRTLKVNYYSICSSFIDSVIATAGVSPNVIKGEEIL